MLNILIILVFLLVTAGLMYLGSIDGDYQVRRSRRIRASIDSAFDKVRDLRTWPVDPASEYPRIRFQGKSMLEPQYCLCKKFSGFIREMETAMKNGFPRLLEYIRQHNSRITGKPFTAYHNVNLTTMHFICDLAVPFAEGIEPGNYTIRILGGGNYDFLESAWYSAYAHLKMHKIKTDKHRPAMEIYENNPGTVSNSNDLLTTLCIPVK